MKKILKEVLAVLVIVIVVILALLAAAVTIFGNQALKIGVETGVTSALKVGANLDSAKLSIWGGSVELNGLKVQNPAGYQHPECLTIAKAAAELDVGSLLSDTIKIKKIQFDDVQLTIEQKGLTTNNLQEILNSLPKSKDVSQPQDTPTGRKLLIHELIINGVQVKVKLLPVPGKADTISLRLNPIVMKEVGSDNPINTAELSAKIIKTIADGVTEQGKDLLPLDIVNSIAKGLAEQGIKVLDTAGQAGKTILEGAGDIGKGATDTLKGIFQKKED